jgi:hydrogenase maturation protease
MSRALVIGYGNECCGDDGIGPAVIRRLETMKLTDVRTLAVHQLSPDLAEAVSVAERVLFVDASITAQPSPITIKAVGPNVATSILSHACTPGMVLALAQMLYGRCPCAWLMQIEGHCFEPGDSLSPLAADQVLKGVDQITNWLIEGSPAYQDHLVPYAAS